jgi:hypothetical protein
VEQGPAGARTAAEALTSSILTSVTGSLERALKRNQVWAEGLAELFLILAGKDD